MWENETVVLAASLKKRIIGDEEKIRFGKIAADSGIPSFVKTFFQNRVEDYITKESPFTVQTTPHFILQPDDLETIKCSFLDVLREKAYFHKQEVEDILNESLILRLDYLVKPADTMKHLLFEKKSTVDLSEMDEILGPFLKILPYADQVLKECKKLAKDSVDKEKFAEIISDVFFRIMEEDPLKVILSDFLIMTEFLSETKGEDIDRVEGKLVLDFLTDRNHWGFRRALEVEMKLGKEDFDSMDLEVTLKRYLELKDEFSEEISTDKKKEPQVQEKVIPKDNGWDLEEVLSDEPFSLEMEVGEKEVSATEKPKPKAMGIIRKETEKDETERPQKKSDFPIGSGLRNLIDEKTEKVMIKKLFTGDTKAYEHLINKLDEAESWRVAKILIDNELFKRDVDPFSKEAIKMVDLVYNRYYPEEGAGGKK